MLLRTVILLFLTLSISCKSPNYIHSASEVFYTPGTKEAVANDSITERVISPYRSQLDAEMNVVLAKSQMVMEKGKPESTLGNFVADLCLEKANEVYQPADKLKVDFCVLNNGGLRSILPEGEITRGDVYELMPFENELVIITLKPESAQKLFDYIAEAGGVPVSGITMQVGTGKAENVKVQGKDLDTTKNYKVVTSDYLSNGGDSMTMFADSIKIEYTGIKIRDAIIDHMVQLNSRQQLITSQTDGRISR